MQTRGADPARGRDRIRTVKTLTLDGSSLSLEDLSPLVAGEELHLAIDPAVEEGIHASRAMVDAHVAAGDVVYGLTTGFGKLKNVAVPREDLAELQRNLVLSHCVGVGDPMPEREVRIAQVLRLNSLLGASPACAWSSCITCATCSTPASSPSFPSRARWGRAATSRRSRTWSRR